MQNGALGCIAYCLCVFVIGSFDEVLHGIL